MKAEEIALKINKYIHEQCIDGVPHDIGWNVMKMFVAESTLPNVKDWVKIWEKYRQETNNEDAWCFFDWLKQHYSAPVSASEQKPDVKWTESEIRTLLNDWNNTKFSFSKLVEIINERVSPQPNKVSPSDEEIKSTFVSCEKHTINSRNWTHEVAFDIDKFIPLLRTLFKESKH